MKFLCDQMLAKLGKWLRAAGYDTMVAADRSSDEEILAQALHEDRYLLTRDHHFLEMKGSGDHIVYLHANSLLECVRALHARLHIDWLYKPFSRCLRCNTLLHETADSSLLAQVPSRITTCETKFWICDQCKKIYWMGTHTQRMLDQLYLWQKEYNL